MSGWSPDLLPTKIYVKAVTQGEYGGIRQVYRAGIGEVLKNLKKAQIIHFDLGIGDPITPAPRMLETPSLIAKNEDISWSVYPVETIIAEKLHSLITHGDMNSRSKDVYDLAVFLPKADKNSLIEAIKRCFEYRETELPKSIAGSLKNLNTTRLEKGWNSALASLSEAPKFKNTFEKLVQQIQGDLW